MQRQSWIMDMGGSLLFLHMRTTRQNGRWQHAMQYGRRPGGLASGCSETSNTAVLAPSHTSTIGLSLSGDWKWTRAAKLSFSSPGSPEMMMGFLHCKFTRKMASLPQTDEKGCRDGLCHTRVGRMPSASAPLGKLWRLPLRVLGCGR